MARKAAGAGMKPAALFISYRRDDTQAFARDLHKHLAAGFGYERVFMDRAEIRAGDHWSKRLDEELERSTVVLVLIGPRWLRLKNPDKGLRIAAEDDWVRRELRVALASDKAVIPIYVGGARPADAKKLPSDIAGLPLRQGIVLTDDMWEDGMTHLVRRLEDFDLRASRPDFHLPTRIKKVAPLSLDEIQAALTTLPNWSLTGEDRTVPCESGKVRQSALYREFAFDRFEDATAFMAATSADIDKGQHHPRWENVWTSVRVWLSTWDIEFKPSHYDVELARWLERAYADFKAGRKGNRAGKAASRLLHADIARRLAGRPGWTMTAGKLERTLRFPDFQSAFGFMASTAVAAEAMRHHPEWFNVNDVVRIQLSTHDAGGITASDFELAERIDLLAKRHQAMR